MTKTPKLMLIIIIIAIASFVRLWNIEVNPAWYSDEGTHIEIARHLMSGEIRYLGVTDSYLIVARLPLFEHILAGWFHLIGVSMFSLRILTSFFGIFSVILVYKIMLSASDNSTVAIVAMALFAVYPQAVIYSRFGFSYNLLPILILLSVYGLIHYYKSRKLIYLTLGSLMLGLATISDFIALAFLPSFIVILIWLGRRHLLISIFCSIIPFAIYSLSQMIVQPDIFVHDLIYTLSRTGGLPIQEQLENISKNISVLFSETWWLPLGTMGLFFIPNRYIRWMIVLFTIPPVLISGRTVALYNLSAYYMIPFLPFIVIGISALLYYGIQRLFHRYVKLGKVISLVSIGLILITSGRNIVLGNQQGFVLGIEHFLINSENAHDVHEFAIDYAKSEDIIITSPTLAWMFNTQVTDFQLASLAHRSDSVHFPAELYPDRFAFDVDYRHANYAIVDNLWRDWGAVHMPIVADMLIHIQQEWKLIYQTDTLFVYQNH